MLNLPLNTFKQLNNCLLLPFHLGVGHLSDLDCSTPPQYHFRWLAVCIVFCNKLALCYFFFLALIVLTIIKIYEIITNSAELNIVTDSLSPNILKLGPIPPPELPGVVYIHNITRGIAISANFRHAL